MAKDIDQQILDDLRQFDFVAQNIWPHVRGLFKRTIAATLQPVRHFLARALRHADRRRLQPVPRTQQAARQRRRNPLADRSTSSTSARSWTSC